MANSWKNLAMLEQKNELREQSHENGATFHFLNVYFRIFLHPDGSHENGSKTVLGIRFQNGAKECIV